MHESTIVTCFVAFLSWKRLAEVFQQQFPSTIDFVGAEVDALEQVPLGDAQCVQGGRGAGRAIWVIATATDHRVQLRFVGVGEEHVAVRIETVASSSS